jgi:hypothetical protein
MQLCGVIRTPTAPGLRMRVAVADAGAALDVVPARLRPPASGGNWAVRIGSAKTWRTVYTDGSPSGGDLICPETSPVALGDGSPRRPVTPGSASRPDVLRGEMPT